MKIFPSVYRMILLGIALGLFLPQAAAGQDPALKSFIGFKEDAFGMMEKSPQASGPRVIQDLGRAIMILDKEHGVAQGRSRKMLRHSADDLRRMQKRAGFMSGKNQKLIRSAFEKAQQSLETHLKKAGRMD
ncbi:MAG: hypothetical protein A2Z83_08310 [Omnitrophica bacterium GWA2_52_8]|nr:MAG: hypothetical protein A2Z83_08310 [Omnitrophica bacterium GWA2_52_8]